MTTLGCSRWRPLTTRINFQFHFGRTLVLRRSGSISVPNFVKISQSAAELLQLLVWENERPPYLNITSGFDLVLTVIIDILFFA